MGHGHGGNAANGLGSADILAAAGIVSEDDPRT
jgi:hypothetical protein